MAEDYYEILGIRPSASQAEIELALKGRRSQYHPDRYAGMDAETLAWATAKMQAINEAYRVLSDPAARDAYAASRTKGQRESPRPSHSHSDRDRQSPRPFNTSGAPCRPVIRDFLIQLDLDGEDAKRIHLAPNIPERKLSAAVGARRFARYSLPSTVHLLVDDTTFGGGVDGLLMTDEYLSFKSLFMDSNDFLHGGGWKGGVHSRGKTMYRMHVQCQLFSFVSTRGVQQLAAALNGYFQARLQWYEAMAKAGDVVSQFCFANSVEDAATETYWLTKAAEGGHVVAQHNLGAMCQNRDPAAAYRWLTMAAKQGSAIASQRLESSRFDQFR